MGARCLVFVAPDEWAVGCVRIKDLVGGLIGGVGASTKENQAERQMDVPFDELLERLERLAL